MALQIKQNQEVLEVLGDLTSQNATTLKYHLNSFLNEFDHIIINFDKVTTIESSAAFTMEQLYLDFMKSNRAIQIIGRGEKAITGVMKATKTSYILSDDRI